LLHRTAQDKSALRSPSESKEGVRGKAKRTIATRLFTFLLHRIRILRRRFIQR
jgi:hypothetical protein